MKRALISTLALALCTAAAGCGEPPAKKPYLAAIERPLHISHRGGSEVLPEDTIFGFRFALSSYRTDVLEIDVHRTADGVLVVNHDETVDRTTDGRGAIRELSYEQIRRFDAGYRFTTDGGKTFPFRGRGIVIPTLDEVFRAFPDTLTNVEAKQLHPAIEEDIARMVFELGMVDKVCLGSFDDHSAEVLRGLVPDACHYAPESMATQFYAATRVGLGGAFPLPVDALVLPPTSGILTVVDEGLLNTAHDRNKEVWVWTINDEDEMKRLFDLGVDGVMSDRPDLLDKVMTEMQLR